MRTSEEQKADNQFWKNLSLLQEATGLTTSFVAKNLGLNEAKFVFYKNNNLIVPFNRVKNLSAKLGLSVDTFWENQLSEQQLRNAIKINSKSRIPIPYQLGNGSRSFTARHILKVAKKYGIYEDVLKTFGLSELSFEHRVDFNISVQLASDIIEFIASKVNLTDEDYSEMSFYNAIYFKNSAFGKELSSSQDVIEMYEHFLSVVNRVEENWHYKIESADHNKLLLNSYPREKMIDTYKKDDYSSFTFLKFRASMAAHLTKYIGIYGTKGTITKSIHHGDSYCQVEFDYSDVRQLSSVPQSSQAQ